MKVGVGEKPKGWDLADYALWRRFGSEDRKLMDEAVKEAGEAVRLMIGEGVDKAMNKYNVKKK